MITTTGNRIDLPQMTMMFRQNLGKRPTLTIAIEPCEIIVAGADSVSVRYRETHQIDGEMTQRWSLTMIVFEAGQPRWRYLQETLSR